MYAEGVWFTMHCPRCRAEIQVRGYTDGDRSYLDFDLGGHRCAASTTPDAPAPSTNTAHFT